MIEIYIICEGTTEEMFIEKVLAPYLLCKEIYAYATIVNKPGQKGGDVKFSRVKKDISNFLKQRNDTYVSTFLDYYGIKEWINLESINENHTLDEIANILNAGASDEINKSYPKLNSKKRFISYLSIHEFETLLFSDSKILAEKLRVDENKISDILAANDENPEKINNSKETAPSKRLEILMNGKIFKKTTLGIEIAECIGIKRIREKCKNFNNWITSLENLN